MSLFSNIKKSLPFPYEINNVNSETKEQLLKDFKGDKMGVVQVGPEKWCFPSNYLNMAKHFYNFEARQNDIWVVTFPRSGTTWTQELVWLIVNNFDYEAAKKDQLTRRFPFFEFSVFDTKFTDNQESIKENRSYESISKISSQRFIKTHFPFSLLPPTVMKNNSKVIYVARNPKDVIVSYYYCSRLCNMFEYCGDLEKYWKYFEKNLIVGTPYWTHVKEGWSHRNDSNVLFLFYEDMINDLPGVIKKVAKFLNKSITEEQIKTLANYLHIENIRNNPTVNHTNMKHNTKPGEQPFIRKGKIGGWVHEFTNELNDEVDRWIKLNCQNTDLQFSFN